ncbi:DUF1127 domain-containing protein [Pseudomonas fluorescens]|nr:DUF1127 domain-containing protein [Pseudomonas fluorescens]
MYCIRNIRWIDHRPRHRLQSSPLEGEMMKGQKGYVLMVKQPFRGLFQRMARWQMLRRERVELAGMSDDALKDIGLSRADVELESHRHFWEDPLRK